MCSKWYVTPGVILVASSVLCIAAGFATEPAAGQSGELSGPSAPTSKLRVDESERIPVAVARDRAKIMHDIYAATLDVMHDRYFHSNRAVVPARAMEDVFTEIQRKFKIDARWISVNMKAMSVDHEPGTDFEKQTAREIAAGKSEFEVIAGGYYRHAGAIPLTSGCVGCHGSMFKEADRTPKFAGLIISVPVSGRSEKLE